MSSSSSRPRPSSSSDRRQRPVNRSHSEAARRSAEERKQERARRKQQRGDAPGRVASPSTTTTASDGSGNSSPKRHSSLSDHSRSSRRPSSRKRPTVATSSSHSQSTSSNSYSSRHTREGSVENPIQLTEYNGATATRSSSSRRPSSQSSQSASRRTNMIPASPVSTAAKTLRNLNIQPAALELGGDSLSSRQLETSRELRTRRLQRERLSTGSGTPARNIVPAPVSAPVPDRVSQSMNQPHYRANSSIVEDYLSRSSGNAGTSRRSAAQQDQQHASTSSSAAARDLLSKTAGLQQFSQSTRTLRKSTPAAASLQHLSSQSSHTPARPPKSAPLTMTSAPQDETPRTLASAVAGWSTLKLRKTSKQQPDSSYLLLDGNQDSKVDQYLASRSSQSRQTTSATAATNADNKSSLYSVRVPSFDAMSSSSSSSSSSCGSDDLPISSASVPCMLDPNEPEWSVRVCVVSAVDFPASVVPNLPFSPIVKVGLLPLAQAAGTLEDKGLEQCVNQNRNAYPIRSTSAKILAQRDKGSVEFHEELRWDRVQFPENQALCLELSSRAVMTPKNVRESPYAVRNNNPASMTSTTASVTTPARLGLFRNTSRAKKDELETAQAAAAVAQLLVREQKEDANTGPLFDSKATNARSLHSSSAGSHEIPVQLRKRRKKHKKTKMTSDLRLGSKVIPLQKLDLQKAQNECVRIEQWFELEGSFGGAGATEEPKRSPPSGNTAAATTTSKRSPSILLEISFAKPEVLDDSEDDVDEADDVKADLLRASFSKRASIKIRNQLKREVVQKKMEEPVLQPGVVDYAFVVGARDMGDQKDDDGARGWVNSTPECVLLERFPATDDFHAKHGRNVGLAEKIEWFCFPEGVKLWRGTTPPNAEEMNLQRFSDESPVSSSTALFDAYLGCTTSFSWFVIASNSEEYGSQVSKTYGAVLRFYVPAPVGIDPTQDDFAQNLMSLTGEEGEQVETKDPKRLWVPLAICLISNLPIVGIMEAMLLRLCDGLSARGLGAHSGKIMEDLANVIINFQKPIRGVVNCSIPFLSGKRFHITLPPRGGLPALPHGNAVLSVCKLLGSDGINFLLAAFLSECKILLHSDDIANLSMVAEVMTALIYPFQWSLPFVPVLPASMMEFIEAPLSYLLGIPTCNLRYVDPSALEDVVVVDLDGDFLTNSDSADKPSGPKAKLPPMLPASAASNISKATNRLLRLEEKLEQPGNSPMPGAHTFPRMEPESPAELEFRLAVAVEVCGLVRGLQDCVVYASSAQPVFNVDKFLQTAPVLFDDQRGTTASSSKTVSLRGDTGNQKIISPRSRRFISQFVSCQCFHQFLEMLSSESLLLYHEIINTLNAKSARRDNSLAGKLMSLESDSTIEKLTKIVEKLEAKIPTYRVRRKLEGAEEDDTCDENDLKPFEVADVAEGSKFPVELLQPIVLSEKKDGAQSAEGAELPETAEGVKQISLEYLVELEKNPWRYKKVFDIDTGDDGSDASVVVAHNVKLRDAIGERRYRSWQVAQVQGRYDGDDFSVLSEDDGKSRRGSVALDLSTLLVSPDGTDDSLASIFSGRDSEDGDPSHHLSAAKGRETIRRCLSRVSRQALDQQEADERNILSEATEALQNMATRRFLLGVLSKRKSDNESSSKNRRTNFSSGASKLSIASFDVLVRLGSAMLDVCMLKKEYDSAYALLKLTAGLYTSIGDADDDMTLVYLTERLGLHPVYADLSLWAMVNKKHVEARHEGETQDKRDSSLDEDETEEYEATISTLYEMVAYGIPAEELTRFASLIIEQNRWNRNERGQALLMLSRRLCVRREQGENVATSHYKTDIELITMSGTLVDSEKLGPLLPDPSMKWVETSWCHPAAKSSRRTTNPDGRRSGTQNLMDMLEEQKQASPGKHEKRLKRSAVTTMAYLGSSMVVTGGLDGGVFVARQTQPSRVGTESEESTEIAEVRGFHLDWGSSGSRYSVGASSSAIDGEYGVGAVSCLAATNGSLDSYHAMSAQVLSPSSKDVCGPVEEEELLEAMDGCRIVAGTTCGDLRVWAVKDVLSAVFYSQGRESVSSSSPTRRRGKDFSAGSSLTRLKFSLRGRALSGHRGGVSCIDVPSSVYRPDSIVSGGADGLIKLWSLRPPGGNGAAQNEVEKSNRLISSPGSESPRIKAARSGDALSILSGHGGRILCVKTAWHGDRLLSGGADRIVRVWDLAGSGGRCLNSLSGHFGWVTSVQFWGPNTIVSASTDRSVALWDSRIRSSPLFTLRHHYAPVSDIAVGPRTDPTMVSAAMDGTVAVWDFRHLSSSDESGRSLPSSTPGGKTAKHCHVVRDPVARLYKQDNAESRNMNGPVLLARSSRRDNYKSIFCLGSDAVVREWDIQSGKVLSEHETGHCDTVSGFLSLQGDALLDNQLERIGPERSTGTITASWDGTVRFRRQVGINM